MKEFRYIENVKSKKWQECIICNTHIKDESMWKVMIPFKYISIVNHSYYICQKCLNNFEDVKGWRKTVIKAKIK